MLKPSNLLSKFGADTQIIGNFRVEVWQDELAESPIEDMYHVTLGCKHRHYNIGHDTGLKDLDDYLDTLREKAYLKKFPHGRFPQDENAPCPHCNQADNASTTEGCDQCNDGYLENPYYIYSGLDIVERITDAIKMDLDFSECQILPLYLYDHSGISISITPFSCQWDSGQVGWAFMTKAQYNQLGHADWDADKALQIISSDVKSYDDYLTGNVYGYSFMYANTDDEDTNAIDACSGFVGDPVESGLFEHLDDVYQRLIKQTEAQEKLAFQKRCAQLKHLIQNRVTLDQREKALCPQ